MARFDTLARRWKQETAHQSNIATRALHPAYQEIIGMGEKVVPLLLAELRREPDDWFWALHAITGANPVPTESRGDLRAMAAAWLRWGLEKRVSGMTTSRLQHLEVIFPELAAVGYSPRSEPSGVYHGIAFAAGDETRSAFEHLGYSVCDSDALETDYEKVVLYVDLDRLWTHAAKQCEDEEWVSKLGSLEDIIHRTPQAVAGPDPTYGRVACFRKRPRGYEPDSKEAESQVSNTS